MRKHTATITFKYEVGDTRRHFVGPFLQKALNQGLPLILASSYGSSSKAELHSSEEPQISVSDVHYVITVVKGTV
jgi:hypothetical protein